MLRIGGAMCAIATLLVATPSQSGAQCTASGSPGSCSQTGSVSMSADHVVKLTISSTTTALPAPTAADFTAGFNTTSGPLLTVSANSSWTLSVRAASATWSATNTSGSVAARTNKPDGDLKWSTSANGTFVALTTSNSTVATGAATAAAQTTLHYRTLYSWALDTPGAYSLAIVLTLTEP